MAANPKTLSKPLPIMHNGDHMKQPEFHFAYSSMPENYRAELIGGVVFEPSPVSYSHARNDNMFHDLITQYAKKSKLAEVAPNATVILSEDDEVQPDVLLRLPEELGGRSRLVGKFLEGAPELVAEIAYSSRAIDLHLKKQRYAKAGVIEYLVFCIEPKKLHWFRLQEEKGIKRNGDGTFCSKVFPGLWINEPALIEANSERADEILAEGLNSEEFNDFKNQLQLRAYSKKRNRRRK
jgi:Uma2 family endonuclease